MKRLLEYFRVLLVSPEAVAILAVVLLDFYRPDLLRHVGLLLRTQGLDGTALTLLAAPSALVVTSYRLGLKVLHPDSGRELLVNWPDYWRLRLRVFAGLSFAAAGLAGWILGWLLIQAGSLRFGALISLASLLVATTTLATIAIAQIGLRDALDGQ